MITLLALVNLIAWLAQTTVVIGAGLLILWASTIDAPAARHGALRALLAVCLLLPLVQPRIPLLSSSDLALLAPGTGHVDVQVTAVAQPQGWGGAALGTRAAALPANAIALVILAGIVARLAWTGTGVVRLRSLRREGERAPGDGEHDELQALIRTRAAIRYGPGLGQPVTFGFRRPVVLLPERLRHLPAPTQRAVVAHELWHVRRRDWIWTVAEETLRAALWFHPAMWVLLSRIQASREEVVDELSVLTTGSRRNYLDALLAFADERPLFAAAAFARRRHLVRRMLLISKESVMSSKRVVASSLALAVAVAATGWYSVLAFPLVDG
ncbi:MAG: M56 family metallopeptidase, partial [Geminicoccales bacterium]